MSSSTGDHGLAEELKKLESADTHEESSKLPALINFILGFSSTKEKSGEPQFLQKPLDIWEPALPVTL